MPNAYVCLLFFRWSNQGTKVLHRTKKLYRKSYFYITTESGPDSKFRKEVYQPLERSITIVHYIGNEALSVSHAHGNTRQQAKLFFRTKPSVFKNIESKVELKAPHKVYKELITQSTTSHEAVSKPRNVKQIQNRKAKVNCLNDEIMVYDSAFDDLPLDEQIVISELVGTDSNVLKVKFADIQLQRNSYDCGLYGIANATALANGRYPAHNRTMLSQRQ